jgi:hypothetical protein
MNTEEKEKSRPAETEIQIQGPGVLTMKSSDWIKTNEAKEQIEALGEFVSQRKQHA